MSVRWTFVACLGGSLAGCFSPDRAGGSGDTDDGTSTGGTDTSAGPTTTMTTGQTTSAEVTSSTSPPETTAPDTTDPDTSASEPDTETTSPPVDCNGADGEPDAACPGEAPFCLAGTCVGCDALADGEVGCTAIDGATPICSGSACVACEEHEECGSGACRRSTGECFPEANRLWVDNTFAGCAAGTGAEASPLCNVVTAVGIIDDQAGDEPWAVFVAGSPTPYTGTIDSNSGRAIAIVGPDQGISATLLGDGGAALDLWSLSPETYVAHVTLESTNTPSTIRGGGRCQVDLSDVSFTSGAIAIRTGGCDIRARRALITGSYDTNVIVDSNGTFVTDDAEISNASAGMFVDGTASLHRTRVWGHYVGGGITVNGALALVNSIVHQNEYQNDGVDVNGGDLSMLYSTVVGAVTCSNGATATIRNSIVLNHNSEAGMVCAAASVDNSVVNAGAAQGAGNVVAGPADLPMIFVDSAQYGGDYHVLPDSVPSGVAVWVDGDPIVDFDGDERPGATDYAGADIP